MAKEVQQTPPSLAHKFLTVSIVLIIICAMTSSIVFFYLYRKEAQKSKAPKDDSVQILKDVGKLMDLPLDETPTIATVQDKTKLENQPLLKKAENGDRIIIYTNAKKAILYRPSTKKIIDVVPINTVSPAPTESLTPVQNTPAAASPSALLSPTAAKQVDAIILNGTEKVGLTNKVETQLLASFPEVKVIDKDNAKKRDYDKTLVVVINPAVKTQAENIAKSLGAELQSLPQDEGAAGSSADIVIIAGKDRI